jgi:hypothetical protein
VFWILILPIQRYGSDHETRSSKKGVIQIRIRKDIWIEICPDQKNSRSDRIRISEFTTLVDTIPYSSAIALNLPVRATRIEYSGTTDSCKIGFLLKYLLDLQQYKDYCILDMFNTNYFYQHQHDNSTSQYHDPQ